MPEEFHETEESAFERFLRDHPLPAPSPLLRDRILRGCREEMLERRRAVRKTRALWRWGFAVATALLLLLNAMEEQRNRSQLVRILESPVPSAYAVRPSSPVATSIHARARLLAALLQEPSAL